ncbi:MlaD family protein [Magnetovibrio blakemorei]|uniref:Mce/MlaD domain-containing protein n=1 Tax=Magnetovibrio blakemorei TaxID=28181 RepID=A0A1E5Q7M9_9PROT|nr:MlaD family protein [Magnetovibrio blakemorei]OEJ67156.1 hypothetical protein BEN30_10290 [Magnetovibrio blakemorei]
MNTARINYVAVGAFVILTLVGVVVSIAMLTGRTGATDAYYSVYKNVTGVKFGTQVFYEGYPIGQVEKVTPIADGGAMSFRVDYEVSQGWQIPDNSIARIGAAGLLSAISINLDAGDSPIAHKPGAMVEAQEASDLFKVMSGVAGDISNMAEHDIRPLLGTINVAVTNFAATIETVGNLLDEDGQRMVKQFGAVASDLSNLVVDLNERLPRIVENVDNSTANFADLSRDLSATRIKIDQLLNSSNAMIGENRSEVRQSMEDLKHVTDSLARHIDSINQNIEGAARNMNEFSREIRQNPGLLLSGTAPQAKGNQ